MKYRLGSLFQVNAHSWARRAYFAVLRLFFGVFGKRQSVHFVRINGTRYKRVVFGDSHEAVLVEQALGVAAPLNAFPPLIDRHENELLLGFVEGRAFDPARPEDRELLGTFLGRLYAVQPEETDSGALARRLEIDLGFLCQAGLIDTALANGLRNTAARLRPESVITGLDYVDPVAKNFVIAEDGHLCAIDVESLSAGQPLGMGIAKAGVHWLDPEARPELLRAAERAAGFTLSNQLPYLELCFRVGWTKRKLLQGKQRVIRIELLRELAEGD